MSEEQYKIIGRDGGRIRVEWPDGHRESLTAEELGLEVPTPGSQQRIDEAVKNARAELKASHDQVTGVLKGTIETLTNEKQALLVENEKLRTGKTEVEKSKSDKAAQDKSAEKPKAKAKPKSRKRAAKPKK